MIKTLLWIPLLTLTLATTAHSEEDLQQTVRELRDQIKLLTARMEAMEQKLAEKEANEKAVNQTATLSTPPPSEPQISASGKPEGKPVEAGTRKDPIMIPGTDTSLSVGGYVKLDAIYNSQSTGGSGGSNQGDQWLLPSSIPVGDAGGEANQITFHARQSRFCLKSLTPTQLGDLSTYLEMDFFAFQSPGDERVSNSYAPRMRHAYGQLGQFWPVRPGPLLWTLRRCRN